MGHRKHTIAQLDDATVAHRGVQASPHEHCAPLGIQLMLQLTDQRAGPFMGQRPVANRTATATA